jgi:hypothetical protein
MPPNRPGQSHLLPQPVQRHETPPGVPKFYVLLCRVLVYDRLRVVDILGQRQLQSLQNGWDANLG